MKKIEKTQMWASIIKYIWMKKAYATGMPNPQIVKDIQEELEKLFIVEPNQKYWDGIEAEERKEYQRLKAKYGQEDSQDK